MGDERLLRRSLPVERFATPELGELLRDMRETMAELDGAGLAAPQIGVGLRVVIFGVKSNPRYPDAEEVPDTVLINPVIEPLGDEVEEGWEGAADPSGARPAPAGSRAPELAAAAAAWILALGVPHGLDSYRPLDLQGPRDGPYVLAFCRETLRTAGRLARSEAVAFDPAAMRFVWGESDPRELGQMRWFLREGWGERPQYGTGDVVMEGTTAGLVVPALGGQSLEARLRLDAPAQAAVVFSLGGRAVGTAVVGPDGQVVALRLPADALVRGTTCCGSSARRTRRLRACWSSCCARCP